MDKLEQLRKLNEIALQGDNLKKEVAKIISTIIEANKELRKILENKTDMAMSDCKTMCKTLENAQGSMEKSLTTLIKESEKNTQAKAYRDLTNAIANIEQQINSIEKYDDSILEKKWTITVEELRKQIKDIKPFILKGQDIVDEINKLPEVEEDQIDFKHIKGWKKYIEPFVRGLGLGGRIVTGGARGVDVSVDGTSYGIAQYVNFIAGTGVTLTHTTVGGRHDILIDASGGSGSFSKLTATGTVDGSNKDFTFTSAPSIIIVDGGRAMQKTSSDGTVNWTGTTSVTLSVAPNSDIYGF